MTANLPLPSTDENISTTLSSGITDVASTMDVADASKIVSPCYVVIDRVDSAGTVKATSLWEYVKVTNVASNTLTITRAQGGSTGQAHSSGAVVEAVVTSAMFEDWHASLNPEHTSVGGHVITGTMTVAGMNLASVATIAMTGITKAFISNLTVSTMISASGASVVGFGGTGGFNPVFQVAGGLASLANAANLVVVPTSFTGNFMQLVAQTPASVSSIFVTLRKNQAVYGVISLLATASFASSASIASSQLSPGDTLTMDVLQGGATTSRHLGADLTLLLRAT